ncbi:hypothetical protein WAI453_006487 [Rhynchosporium graminicola]
MDRFNPKLVSSGYSRSSASHNASPDYCRGPTHNTPACACIRTPFASSCRKPYSDLLLYVLVCADIPRRLPLSRHNNSRWRLERQHYVDPGYPCSESAKGKQLLLLVDLDIHIVGCCLRSRRCQQAFIRDWGTFIPVLTNVACIGLIYSVIAPLILVFIIMYFGVLWLLYRSYPPMLTEPGLTPSGLFYPTAIRQLFIGVYFMELCLTGLFFLWLLFVRVLKRPADQADNEFSPRRSQSEPKDEALTSARPIIWIPKDELGVADDEISNIRKTYDSIWISNEGASLDAQGRLRVWEVLLATSGEN